MFANIEKKLKESEEFDKNCTDWIEDYELQIKQMKYMKEQNSNMITACKEMLSKTKKINSLSVSRQLDFKITKSKPTTPPTPTRIIPTLSEATDFSQSFLTQNEYETPKKTVHFKESDLSDSEDDSVLRTLLSDNKVIKSDKTKNEENSTKIQRKRMRTKK